MDKGTRVRITGGRKAVGTAGVVFWYGPNKFGEGMRVGVKTDDGGTEWVNEDHVERLEGEAPQGAVAGAGAAKGAGPDKAAAPPGPEPPPLEKGDRVRFEDSGQSGVGEIFWYGRNKFGPGMRVGLKDEAGEKHWLAATQVQLLERAGGPAASGAAPGPGSDDGPPPIDDDNPAADDGPPPIDDDSPPPEVDEDFETEVEL